MGAREEQVPNIDTAIVDAKRRATKYQDIDGLPALALSAYSFMLGSVGLLRQRTNSPIGDLLLVVGLVGWLFVATPDAPLMLWLKTRITYPRTGFVAMPQPKFELVPEGSNKRRVLAWVALGMLLLGFVLSAYRPSTWASLIILTAGCGLFLIAYRNDARTRLLWLFIPSLWVSAWIEKVLPAGNTQRGGGYMWLVFGTLLFIVGTTRLLRYLMQHRVPHQ
jgi:hypothetical protein